MILDPAHGSEDLQSVQRLLAMQRSEVVPRSGLRAFTGTNDLQGCFVGEIETILQENSLLTQEPVHGFRKSGKTHVWIAALVTRLLEFQGTELRIGFETNTDDASILRRLEGALSAPLRVRRFKSWQKIDDAQVPASKAREPLMRMVVRATQDIEYRKALVTTLSMQQSIPRALPQIRATFGIRKLTTRKPT